MFKLCDRPQDLQVINKETDIKTSSCGSNTRRKIKCNRNRKRKLSLETCFLIVSIQSVLVILNISNYNNEMTNLFC